MGRMKLAMRTIETSNGKQVTFSKRKAGLEKKAKELATLCDIDLLLILFSPAAKLSWINGSNSTPEQILMRFANVPFQEREKRKVEVLEQLKRAFKKIDHDINVDELMTRKRYCSQSNYGIQSIEELQMTHLHNIQAESMFLLQKLRKYESFQTVEDANNLQEFLLNKLQEIQIQKRIQESNQYAVPYVHLMEQQNGLELYSSTKQMCSDIDQMVCNIIPPQHDAQSVLYESTTDNLKFENQREDKSDLYTKTFGEVSYEDDNVTKDENISDPNLVKYDEVELSYLASDPLLQGNGLLPFPWLSNLDSSNPLTIHDGHPPDSYYLQQSLIEAEGVKVSSTSQEDRQIGSSESFSEIIPEVNWLL